MLQKEDLNYYLSSLATAMIPAVLATIKEIAACQTSISTLDLIETKLRSIQQTSQGVNISRVGGGNICVFEQEPYSPHAGPGSLVILVKVANADPAMHDGAAGARASTLERSLHVHEERAGGKGIAKALMIAVLLDWLGDLSSPHRVGTVRVVFYGWSDANIGAVDRFAAVLPVNHAFLWFMEPTNAMACPAEKGFGKLTITFNTDGSSTASDMAEKLSRSINERFKPSHPVYPLDPNNRLSFRFLPGAQHAVASPSSETSPPSIYVTFSHHPLAPAFKQDLTEHVNAQGKRLGVGDGLRIKTEHHFPGALFDTRLEAFQRFIAIHRRIFFKEPYMDWHVHPSMASAVFKHHPAAPAVIYGLGDPYLVEDGQAIVSATDASDFRDLLGAVGEEFLFKT
ncbi:MAG: hypothetical protein Q6373_025470 [Candidatus Sigynarchaeota archaeon]